MTSLMVQNVSQNFCMSKVLKSERLMPNDMLHNVKILFNARKMPCPLKTYKFKLVKKRGEGEILILSLAYSYSKRKKKLNVPISE